jgi:hypothetical protein
LQPVGLHGEQVLATADESDLMTGQCEKPAEIPADRAGAHHSNTHRNFLEKLAAGPIAVSRAPE